VLCDKTARDQKSDRDQFCDQISDRTPWAQIPPIDRSKSLKARSGDPEHRFWHVDLHFERPPEAPSLQSGRFSYETTTAETGKRCFVWLLAALDSAPQRRQEMRLPICSPSALRARHGRLCTGACTRAVPANLFYLGTLLTHCRNPRNMCFKPQPTRSITTQRSSLHTRTHMTSQHIERWCVVVDMFCYLF
jgi:hypothetical protein